MSLSEIYHAVIDSTVLKVLRHPFFSLGDFELSVWLLIKAGILFWCFVLVARILDKVLDKHIYPKLNLELSVKYALATAIRYVVIFIGLITVVNLLGINLNAFTVFAGTIGIGLGLGLQDIAKNFISGLVILIERPIKVGDYIEVGNVPPGRVREIKARSTIVDTFDNTSVVVPNAEFISERIINWSYTDRVIRLAVEVGVAYGSNTNLVKDILLEVAAEHPKVLKDPAPQVWFENFGDSSLDFKLLCWCQEPDKRRTIRSDLNFAIDRNFREKGVTIPFPQRDLHLKSSNIPLQ